MDQPGTVANPARGQLNRETNISLSPCVPENLVSRDGFSRPVTRQPAHHHTQAESGAYLRNSSRGIVHRNRKRFLLSQATLREEFAEKKYQVFDIIGLLTILVQVNLSSPVESRGVLESVNHNIGAASACRSARSVKKLL